MGQPRQSEAGLWRTVRVLSETEKRRLLSEVRGTRVEWLLRTLLRMDTYSEEDLQRRFRRAFPGASLQLVRAYKHLLWQAIERIVPAMDAPLIGEEVQIWQRFWLSLVLYQRGLYEEAEVLWQKALYGAVKMGWYEIALWGISLLEVYARDFHRADHSEQVAPWCEKLTGLIRRRYAAITRKISVMEKRVKTRVSRGWHLPPLPVKDNWSAYMKVYSSMLSHAPRIENHPATLYRICRQMELLSVPVDFPATYVSFHRMLSFINLGIQLVNLRAWDLMPRWYDRWQILCQNASSPHVQLYANLYHLPEVVFFIYLMHSYQWQAAWEFMEKKKEVLRQVVLASTHDIIFRSQVAILIHVLLVVQVGEPRELAEWRLAVERWMESEELQDVTHFWWVLSCWYEAYRSGDRRWMRHWYRRLFKVWSARFTHINGIEALLGVVRAATHGLPATRRRRAIALLGKWSEDPMEKARRSWGGAAFPTQMLLESIVRRCPMERLLPSTVEGRRLPARLHQRIAVVLDDFMV